ncbi:hypothetical protein YC2023_040583 [Brassica napus]
MGMEERKLFFLLPIISISQRWREAHHSKNIVLHRAPNLNLYWSVSSSLQNDHFNFISRPPNDHAITQYHTKNHTYTNFKIDLPKSLHHSVYSIMYLLCGKVEISMGRKYVFSQGRTHLVRRSAPVFSYIECKLFHFLLRCWCDSYKFFDRDLIENHLIIAAHVVSRKEENKAILAPEVEETAQPLIDPGSKSFSFVSGPPNTKRDQTADKQIKALIQCWLKKVRLKNTVLITGDGDFQPEVELKEKRQRDMEEREKIRQKEEKARRLKQHARRNQKRKKNKKEMLMFLQAIV